jgi:hypothetical protein
MAMAMMAMMAMMMMMMTARLWATAATVPVI